MDNIDDDHRHPGVLFSDVATRESQWEELSYMLNYPREGHFWRALGVKLNVDPRRIDRIAKTEDPARVLLGEWQHQPSAYVDVLLDTLKDIDNYTAYLLVHSWIACEKNDTSKPETPVQVIPVFSKLSSNKELDDLKQWKHVKLIMLGNSGAGKSSTIRWLKGEPFIGSHISTVGAELHTTDMCDWKDIEIDTKDFIADLINSKPAEISTSKLPYADAAQNRRNNDKNNNNNKVPMLSPELVTQIAQKCKKLSKELPSVFHVWDFGGQEVYYNTHHFFLSTSTIYTLVIDISKPLDLPQIKFWLDSIQFYARDAPVIIVGTHRDCVSPFWLRSISSFLTNQYFDPELIGKLKAEYSPKGINIKEGFTVSCKDDSPKELRQKLLEIATTDASLQRKCELRWMLFFDALKEQSKESYALASLSIDVVMAIAQYCGFGNLDEAVKALIFFHELGFMLYFHTEEKLKDIVFTRPEKLIELFNHTIITTDVERKKYLSDQERVLLGEQGIISHKTLSKLWKKFPVDLHPKFKVLLTKFGLGLPDPNAQASPECDFVFPCLIESPEADLDRAFKNALVLECLIQVVPPLGFASRLIVRILEITRVEGAYKYACQLYKGGVIFTLHGVQTKLDVEAGKVTIQLLKTDNDNCLKTLQVILDCIYSTAAKESAPTIQTAMTTCINGHPQKIFVLPKQDVTKLHILDLCCKECRGKFDVTPLLSNHGTRLFAPQYTPQQIVNEMQYHIPAILFELQNSPKPYINDGMIQVWGHTDYKKTAGLYQYLQKCTNPQLLEVMRNVMEERGLGHLLHKHNSDDMEIDKK